MRAGRAAVRALRARCAAAASPRGRRRRWPARWRSRWICASKPPPLSELAENTRDDPDFRVPKPDWELTARDVLTIDWIDGIRLNDVAAIEAAGPRPGGARAHASSSPSCATRIRDGFFHADMHPGNLFVDRARPARARSISASWAGSASKERRFLAEILLGFIRRDYRRVAEVHFEAGYVPPHHSVEDFAQAIRAIGEPIHDRTRRRDLDGEAADAAVRDHRRCST